MHRQIMILRRRHVRLAQPWKGEQGDAGWAIGAAVGREPAGAEHPRGDAFFVKNFVKIYS